MRYSRRTHAVVLAACLALLAAPAGAQERLALSGRVVMEPTTQQRRAAAPRLTVRLYFPRETRRPTLVTYTDSGGAFRFNDLQAGRYLLEIYQGTEMVYQRALALDRNLQQPLNITLRPR